MDRIGLNLDRSISILTKFVKYLTNSVKMLTVSIKILTDSVKLLTHRGQHFDQFGVTCFATKYHKSKHQTNLFFAVNAVFEQNGHHRELSRQFAISKKPSKCFEIHTCKFKSPKACFVSLEMSMLQKVFLVHFSNAEPGTDREIGTVHLASRLHQCCQTAKN